MREPSVQNEEDLLRLRDLGLQDSGKLAQFLSQMAREKQTNRIIPVLPSLEKAFPDHAAIASAACDLWNAAEHKVFALKSSERAARLESGNYKYIIQHILCLIACNKIVAAKECFDRLETIMPEADAKAFLNIAQIAFRLDMYEESVRNYECAIALEPNNHSLHYSLGAVHRFLGNFVKAEMAFDQALRLNPKEYEAYYIRATLRKQSEENNHINRIKEMVSEEGIHPMGKAFLCYALAKELDDLKKYDESFLWLSEGARTRRELLTYDVAQEVSVMNDIISSYNADVLLTDYHGCQTGAPVFIVGLPRTGSTLIERILSSHPLMESAGELSEFPLLMSEMVSRLQGKKQITSLDKVKASLEINYEELGAAYLNRVKAKGFNGRFIDKLPLNFLNVGLVHLALPKAKIIWSCRDPVETCFAMYKTLFSRAYPFSYDLDEIAEYYIGFHRLMEHWTVCLPNKIYRLDYEALVSNQEEESRKLLSFCGLDWDPTVLQFQRNTAPSTTASAVQVRDPIYKTSLSKSLPYQSQLSGLLQKLQSAGVA